MALSYSGLIYNFAANYFGGSGNDLVLQWAGTRVFDWGKNDYGQLGNYSTTASSVPVAVTTTGVLAGKTVIAVAAGYDHSLALCSDGSLAAWGRNAEAQLGNNGTTASSVPVAVNTTPLPAGARFVAIGPGPTASNSVALVAAAQSPISFQQWKLTHLGDANAPDNGDTDFDGLPTILEYATGGDPDVAGPLPVGSTVEGKLTITFPRNSAATDVSFTVQGSDDLSTWTDLARSTAGAPMEALDVGVNVVETGAEVLRTVAVRDLFLTTDPAHPRRYLRLRGLP